MKKKKKRSSRPTAAGQLRADLKAVRGLEKDIHEQVSGLEEALAARDHQPQTRPQKPSAPFPQALGRHLLHRLLALEAAADRLAAQAEKQGDHKTALRAVQVSVRLVNTVVRLVDKHPHLAADWQPESQECQTVTAAGPPAIISHPGLYEADTRAAGLT